MTYAQLIADVAAYLHRTDLTSMMSRFVALAEARFSRVLRVRQMETAITGTIASNEVALPADFVGTKVLYAVGYEGTPLLSRSVDYVISRNATDGIPVNYAVTNGAWLFDGSGDIEGTYYAAVPSLETDDETWLSIAAPDAYLFGTLSEACLYVADEQRASMYAARAAAAIAELAGADARDRHSGLLAAVKR